MLFSSFSFLLWFLPLVLGAYFLPLALPHRDRSLLPLQNAVLLLSGLLFYAWGEPIYLFLMLFSITLNAFLAKCIERSRHALALLWVAVLSNVSLLLFFKYPPLLGLKAPHLPLGISFYTFQALSYVIDVYRGRVKAAGVLHVALYISFFPQLIAGPILAYTDMEHALQARSHSLHGAACGARRFVAGLAKKLLLANPAGALFATLAASKAAGTALSAWLALLGFFFQIYFDFSGYSDMAIGLGRIFGFRFPENFNYPYTAASITDFWRRWHITLSSFFREYVYFPLGGSRRGSARTVFNLLVVWSLTGLWHGAGANFLLWGLYYFVLLTLEKFFLRRQLQALPLSLSRALTLLATLGGWLIFAFDGTSEALALSNLPRFLGTLLGKGGFLGGNDLFVLLQALPLLLLCALGATPLPRALFYRLTVWKKRYFWRAVLPALALLLCTASLVDAAYNPFLYFRF